VAYVALLEIAGIPGVNLGYSDQTTFAKTTALINGCPNVRWIDVARVGTGAERVDAVYAQIIKALTDPLTAKEKESGMYVPPPPPRIIFEGTLDDAQEYFQQTVPVANCYNCPIAKYTDGLPVIIPTEDKVKEMLTGTSHKPDEQIYRYTRDATTGEIKKGTSPVLYARAYYATVEKVATIAVMAGCKPEYMPVVLAVATSGGGDTSCPGTSGATSLQFVVSGPIAKEIGMNSGQDAFDVGNTANMSILRAGQIMTVSFGGCYPGGLRSTAGNPVRVCFAEDVNGLPPGWEGFNEDSGYKKTESVFGKGVGWGGLECGWGFLPSAFRGMVAEGFGGMARQLGVEGQKGPHNFLEAICPYIYPGKGLVGGITIYMHLNMAKSLYDFGFKKKADVYKWMSSTYFVTKGELYNNGWWEHSTDGGRAKEPTSGKTWGELPMDYKVPVFGADPMRNCIIVANSFADETCYVAWCSRPSAYPIDPWR
jgi:hypothetical protein